eukprot:816552_1
MPHRHHTYRDQNQDLYPNDDNPVLNHSNKHSRKARKHRDRESSNSKSSSYDHNGRHRPSHRHTDYEYSFRDQDSYPHDDNPVPNHSNKHRRKHRDRESSYSKCTFAIFVFLNMSICHRCHTSIHQIKLSARDRNSW